MTCTFRVCGAVPTIRSTWPGTGASGRGCRLHGPTRRSHLRSSVHTVDVAVMTGPNQTKRRIATLVLILAVICPAVPALAAPLVGGGTSAVGTTATDEAGFFALMNSSRARAGLPALQHD